MTLYWFKVVDVEPHWYKLCAACADLYRNTGAREDETTGTCHACDLVVLPTAELTIIERGGSVSYLLYFEQHLVWNTRSYATPEGRDGARARLRQWLKTHPYRVVLAQEGVEKRTA